MKISKQNLAIFLLPTLILFIIVYAYPLITLVGTSLTTYSPKTRSYDFVGFQNYYQLFFKDRYFYDILKNTLLWVFLHCTIHVFIGVSVALILFKKPKLWKFTRTVYIIPNIISSAALSIVFLNAYNPNYGIIHKILSFFNSDLPENSLFFVKDYSFLAVTSVWIFFAAYTTILVLAEMMSTSKDVYEAAKIDGASALQTDLMITIPLAKNMICTTTIMAATYMLQVFDYIALTSEGGPGVTTTNLPIYLYKVAMNDGNYTYANAISVIVILIGITIMTLIRKIYKIED